MWKVGLFTFDANVLLNIYRYSQTTRDVLFQILDQLHERIWVPHQAALEFHRGRRGVISTQARAYDGTCVTIGAHHTANKIPGTSCSSNGLYFQLYELYADGQCWPSTRWGSARMFEGECD